MYKNGNSKDCKFTESSIFVTRKFYVINVQNNGQYGRGNEND